MDGDDGKTYLDVGDEVGELVGLFSMHVEVEE